MINFFKKKNSEIGLSSLSSIVTSGATVGVSIANYVGKNAKTGGIIGVRFSLLISGLLESVNEKSTTNYSKK